MDMSAAANDTDTNNDTNNNNNNNTNSATADWVYLVQGGVLRYGGETGPVCGRWTAQPLSH